MSQPNQLQYPLSTLNLFTVFANRATYQQATGNQAPPFDSKKPVQYWQDSTNPVGTATYNIFNSKNPVNIAVTQTVGGGVGGVLDVESVPVQLANIPGTYTYPTYISAPTDAVEVGPFGPIGQVSADVVCMQADAQEIANEVVPVAYPGQPFTVTLGTSGVYQNVYGQDPRREWFIQVGSNPTVPAAFMLAQGLIEAKNQHGVGAPGHWAMLPTPGSTDTKAALQWVQDPQVIAPVAGQATNPVPLRSLLPNEELFFVPGTLFNQAGTWLVQRTDMPVPPIPATLDSLSAKLDRLLAKLGA